MLTQLSYLPNLVIAAALSMLVGTERQFHHKQAGIRTHALVGMGSALFMVVSKYGFFDLPGMAEEIDGSRIAAQVASGIGFLGAGLIFVRRDNVHGLTTAASIWVVAAVGLAAGAGMTFVAAGAVLIHLLVTVAVTPLARILPTSGTNFHIMDITYQDGRGALREVLELVTTIGFAVADFSILSAPSDSTHSASRSYSELAIRFELSGKEGELVSLVSSVSQAAGISNVTLRDANRP